MYNKEIKDEKEVSNEWIQKLREIVIAIKEDPEAIKQAEIISTV
jgi:hypothetical protein